MSIRISDRSVTVNLAEISFDFFVRKELNHDWALQLGELVESGVDLDPIFITREKKGIDGRHRYEGHALAKKSEIKCKYVEADSEEELISFALKCNWGGALPPTTGDIEHTIQELLNRGVPKKQLAETLTFIPGRLVRKYLAEVESKLLRSKLAKAATAVAEGGLNVPTAATQYNVEEKDLRAMLSNTTKRRTKNGIEELEREFSKRFRTQGNRNAAALKKVLELYRDGDVSHKQVLKVFSHLEHLLKGESRAINGWRKRFDAMEAPKKIA